MLHRTLALTALLSAGTAALATGQWRTDFSRHTVPIEEVTPGGPPKDGIPAIDRPKFVDVPSADRWLDARDPVALVTLGGVAKAYPLQILIRHEIVNDEVGGVPVSVTYCPLCNTTLAFDRRFGDQVLDFGTTGWLRHSDLVMYDRQTETWWQQATGEGIIGEHAGEQLTFLPSPVISWRDFKSSHPDGEVLSRETGYPFDYGHNPYAGYDTRRGPFRHFFSARQNDQLPAMERVVALDVEGDGIAVPFSALRDRRVISLDLHKTPVVVWWTPGTASAVDEAIIAEGRDVGSAAVFESSVDGRRLQFSPTDDGQFRDRETGSTWSISGKAVAGPLAGTVLTPVNHGNHFWFAWGVFRPETEIVRK